MAKVHSVTDARVHPVEFERGSDATPARPRRAVYLRVIAPTTDESPLPVRDGEQWLAFSPVLAKMVGEALQSAARAKNRDDE